MTTVFRAVYYGWEGIEEEHFFITKELAENFIEIDKEQHKNKRALELEEIVPLSNKEEFEIYVKDCFPSLNK